MHRRSICVGFVGPLSAIASIAVTGCGGDGDFGTSVPFNQSREAVLTSADLDRADSTALPTGDFNVADAQRESQGRAAANSSADAKGAATCSVDASAGGTGTAEFQIGRVFRYDGSAAADVHVVFRVSHSGKVRMGDSSEAPRAALKAYVSDSNRRNLGKIMLVDTDAEHPAGDWSGEQSPSFSVTLEPGTAYHFIVAGLAAVTGDPSAGAAAELAVDSLSIEVVRRTN